MGDTKLTPSTVRARGRWRRRLAWAAGGLAALGLVAVVTVDWWLPPLVTGVAGAGFAERETVFGDALTWSGLSWRDAELGVAVEVERMRLDAPSRILLRGGKANAEVDGWTLTISPASETKAGAGAEFGWPELMDALGGVGRRLERWVGAAKLTKGRVRVAGEEIVLTQFEVAGADTRGVAHWRGEAVAFELGLTSGHVWVRLPKWKAETMLTLKGRTQVAGSVGWEENIARVEAEFADGSWMPTAFDLAGTDWRVPAERLGLAGKYDDLRGRFAVRRAGAGVSVELGASAQPVAPDLPELSLAAVGRADATQVVIQALSINAPQLKARLSAPLVWGMGEGWAGVGEPVFTWEAELAALTGGRVTGAVSGGARWRRGERWRIAWEARGVELGWREWTGVALELRGESTVERTRVSTAKLSAPGGAEVAVSGAWIHAERRIEGGEVAIQAEGAELAAWLPEGLAPGSVTARATVEGEPASLRAKGTATVARATYAGWAADEATVDFEGALGAKWALEARARRGEATVDAAGSTDGERLQVTRLNLARADGAVLALEMPAVVDWTSASRRVALALAGGGERRLAVDWTEKAEANLRVQNLDTSWVMAWRDVAADWPDVAVGALTLASRVGEDGFVRGEGDFDLRWRMPGEQELWARGAGTLDEGGARLDQLAVGRGTERLAEGGGVVPWRLRVGATRGPEAVEDGEWSFKLKSSPEAGVWGELAKLAGLTLESPALMVELAGPAREPSGRVELTAARIGFEGEGLPPGGVELRVLDVAATVTAGELAVRRLTAEVDGQRIEAEGRLELADGDWARLRAQPFVWLRDHAQATLRVPEARVSALARYLPRVLAPSGRVEAELTLTPGAKLAGWVRLRGGATRPLGDFGVLHEIEVDLALADYEIRVERATARAGGQAVTVTGGARRLPAEEPKLDLRLKAERFPLLRKPGLLLRGDLDLAVKTDETTGRTRVGGEVRMRDSLFLVDIRPLISASSGGASAAAARARPPYFSVDTEPLGGWELGVTVRGEEFLRLRTPVFEGVGSTRFSLAGTLREPRVQGEFVIDAGRILFPFATFTVQDGAVRILRNDPFTPRLDFRAQGRRLGYDLRLELTGTADAPQLQLFSTPALDAEALLLMVTAGVAPEQDQTSRTSQRLAAVGAYVSRDLLRTLGLAGTDEERLSIQTGEQVSRAGRETYGFEFRLDERWSLVGDYDEFDAYNMGVKWRIRAKPPVEQLEREERDEREETMK